MFSRRRFVRGVGAVTLAGALAGCSGDGEGEETETETETETEAATDTPTPTPSDGDDGSGDGGVPAEVSEYLSETGNFDGSVADRTGQESVTIAVGAEGNGGAFAFAPPAVRVDTGTEVVWEWTGEGGQHNVAAEDGADFESELVSEAGHTFSWTPEESGIVTYVCTPHESLGMKGALVVE